MKDSSIIEVRNVEDHWEPYDIKIEDLNLKETPAPDWIRYIICGLLSVSETIPFGARIVVGSDVPCAVGVSSSSALSVSTALAFGQLYGVSYPKIEFA